MIVENNQQIRWLAREFMRDARHARPAQPRATSSHAEQPRSARVRAFADGVPLRQRRTRR